MADINSAGPKRSGPYRAALAAVIILSLLLAAAFAGVVVGFMRQYQIYSQAKSAAQASPAKASR